MPLTPPRPDSQLAYRLRWKPARQVLRSQVPEGLLDWLLDTASLTRRIQLACDGAFRVRVLEQGWGRPRRDEIAALGMRADERALIRQVQLHCGDRVWVYARTIIPHASLTGRQRRLAHLGSKPLGAVLFADPGMRRGPVQVARIRRGQALYEAACRDLRGRPQEIWGRRSVFRLGGKPLLVAEVFLPDLPLERHGLMVHDGR
jgi:chorismate--pyruvate lyase